MILFHGSNMEVADVDLSQSSKGKDFGRGFYLSDNETQAKRMAKVVTDRKGVGSPIVSKFEFYDEILKTRRLKVKVFKSHTKSWAEFILQNRRNDSDTETHDFDIVIGPIADDRIGLQIFRFTNGYISITAFIREIKYIEPTIQYLFHTEKAVKMLKHIK